MTGDAPDRARVERLMRWATYASVTVAVILILAKAAVWLQTQSMAMLASLVDSTLDAAASLINLLALRLALTPADREHRFGHGKAEAVAGLAQSAVIAGSALFLLLEAARRLAAPLPVGGADAGIAVSLLAIVLSGGLVLYQRHVVRLSGSLVVAADRLHYLSDLLLNAAVIAALVLAQYLGWALADPLFGLGVALYILFGAWGIGRRAFDHLMDRELSDELRERIKVIAMRHPGVRDIHDLRTRESGMQQFIQFHLALDGRLRLVAAHAIAVAVHQAVQAEFPDADIIIHQDPSET